MKWPLPVYTVRVLNSPLPVHMCRAWVRLRSYDIAENCFGQFNLSHVNAVENSPNCIGYLIHVTVVYPVVCSGITRRIISIVARPIIVCPFCITTNLY